MSDSISIESENLELLLDISPADLVLATSAPYRIIPETDTIELALEDLTVGVTIDAATGARGADGVSARFHDLETPSGVIDGVNPTFMLADLPASGGILIVTNNGLRQATGADLTVSGQTLTFLSGAIPETGDILRATYNY